MKRWIFWATLVFLVSTQGSTWAQSRPVKPSHQWRFWVSATLGSGLNSYPIPLLFGGYSISATYKSYAFSYHVNRVDGLLVILNPNEGFLNDFSYETSGYMLYFGKVHASKYSFALFQVGVGALRFQLRERDSLEDKRVPVVGIRMENVFHLFVAGLSGSIIARWFPNEVQLLVSIHLNLGKLW